MPRTRKSRRDARGPSRKRQPSPHLSLQQEARFTFNRGDWGDQKLRNAKVTFVSAGVNRPSAIDPTDMARMSRSGPSRATRVESRPSSPTGSDSSQEVILFKGRDNMGRGRVEEAASCDDLDREISNLDDRIRDKEDELRQLSSNAPVLHSAKSQSSWQTGQSSSRAIRTEQDDALAADYIANMDAQDNDADLLTAFQHRDLGGGSDVEVEVWVDESSSPETKPPTGTSSARDRLDSDDLDGFPTSAELFSSVQEILAKRETRLGLQYLVVWDDRTRDDCRWVAASALTDISGAAPLIEAFKTEAQLVAKVAVTSGESGDDTSDEDDPAEASHREEKIQLLDTHRALMAHLSAKYGSDRSRDDFNDADDRGGESSETTMSGGERVARFFAKQEKVGARPSAHEENAGKATTSGKARDDASDEDNRETESLGTVESVGERIGGLFTKQEEVGAQRSAQEGKAEKAATSGKARDDSSDKDDHENESPETTMSHGERIARLRAKQEELVALLSAQREEMGMRSDHHMPFDVVANEAGASDDERLARLPVQQKKAEKTVTSGKFRDGSGDEKDHERGSPETAMSDGERIALLFAKQKKLAARISAQQKKMGMGNDRLVLADAAANEPGMSDGERKDQLGELLAQISARQEEPVVEKAATNGKDVHESEWSDAAMSCGERMAQIEVLLAQSSAAQEKLVEEEAATDRKDDHVSESPKKDMSIGERMALIGESLAQLSARLEKSVAEKAATSGEARDDSSDEDDHESESPETAMSDGERMARLLAKQEELGMGSDRLMLFDAAANDAEEHDDEWRYRSRGTFKRSRRDIRAPFPPASALADAYDDFDVMDRERPSIQRKKRGKKGKAIYDAALSDLDDDLAAEMQAQFEKDRNKKAFLKRDRERQRAQGLLGKGKGKYTEGITMSEIKKELKSFISSDRPQFAFPPMDKKDRLLVHLIANTFHIKTTSYGSGTTRFPMLIRTARTLAWDEALFARLEQRLGRRFFPRPEAGRKGGDGPSARAGYASVGYRDGEVVGASAPELGAENKGRAMLERMGWTQGDALGARNNKGILLPVAHVVKTTRSALGHKYSCVGSSHEKEWEEEKGRPPRGYKSPGHG